MKATCLHYCKGICAPKAPPLTACCRSCNSCSGVGCCSCCWCARCCGNICCAICCWAICCCDMCCCAMCCCDTCCCGTCCCCCCCCCCCATIACPGGVDFALRALGFARSISAMCVSARRLAMSLMVGCSRSFRSTHSWLHKMKHACLGGAWPRACTGTNSTTGSLSARSEDAHVLSAQSTHTMSTHMFMHKHLVHQSCQTSHNNLLVPSAVQLGTLAMVLSHQSKYTSHTPTKHLLQEQPAPLHRSP